MIYLIDTNIIIRYLIQDNKEHFAKSQKIFKQIERMDMHVEILDGVIMECLYVLIKFYKLPKNEVIDDMRTILYLDVIVNNNKHILLESLTIYKEKNIDFIDCQLCAKRQLENYEIISFDSDLSKC